jgi:hypothetical protein
MSDFSNMTKEEAIEYCYSHRAEYVGGFPNDGSRGGDGCRAFDCLIEILEGETIHPKDLPDYGMDFEKEEMEMLEALEALGFKGKKVSDE